MKPLRRFLLPLIFSSALFVIVMLVGGCGTSVGNGLASTSSLPTQVSTDAK